MTVKKKKRPNSAKARVSGKRWTRVQWVAIGIDVSTYSISLAGTARTKDGKIRSAKAISKRWTSEVDYHERIRQAAKAHELVHDLLAKLKVDAELHQVFIAVEEPVAIGHAQRGASQRLLQQAQIGGAVIGSLLRYGWTQVYEIQWQKWAKLVADDLGITTHHTKWNPDKKVGKYRAQQWVKQFHPKWDGGWPDLVKSSKLGLVPRGNSKARGVQSDDRYEALGVMWWMRTEIGKT